jgi:hypothetical protein
MSASDFLVPKSEYVLGKKLRDRPIQVQDCLTISGAIVVTLQQQNGASPTPPAAGTRLTLITTARPECFFSTMNESVTVQGDTEGCKQTKASLQNETGTKTLSIAFFIDSSKCIEGIRDGGVSAGAVAGGVIGAVVAIAAIIAVAWYIIRKRNMKLLSSTEDRI